MPQNVRLKIKTGPGASDWVEIHPKTNINQILDASGNELSSAVKNLLGLSNPGATSFILLDASGNPSYITPSNVPGEIGAAEEIHGHDMGDISGLAAALANKADLSGGKILSSQIPGWMIGGLKKGDAYNISSTSLTLDSTFLTNQGMDNTGDTDGKYVIITNPSGCDVTLGANFVLTTGDEGQTSGTIHLEDGDWIVFRGYNSPNYEFDVINNDYRVASTTEQGIVRLADGNVTTRAGLASSSNPAKVIDEYALSKVLKGIYYTDDADSISNSKIGDLAIEY